MTGESEASTINKVLDAQLIDGDETVYTLTQTDFVSVGTPAGVVHCTFVVDANRAAIGAIVPNEHTAELSIKGIDVPEKVIVVPPIAALDAGDTLDTTGALCRDQP